MLEQHTFTDARIDGLGMTTGSPADVLRIVSAEAGAFEAHVASLPTLEDLIEDARRDDPDFDEHFATADEELYRESLRAVDAGQLSRIAAERLRLGITQADLAERAEMQQPNISRLERPRAAMTVSTARRLARALGMDDYRDLLP